MFDSRKITEVYRAVISKLDKLDKELRNEKKSAEINLIVMPDQRGVYQMISGWSKIELTVMDPRSEGEGTLIHSKYMHGSTNEGFSNNNTPIPNKPTAKKLLDFVTRSLAKFREEEFPDKTNAKKLLDSVTKFLTRSRE